MYKVMIVPDIWSDDLFDLLDDAGMWIYVGMWQIAERSAVFEPKFREIAKKLGKRYTPQQVETAYRVLVQEGKIVEFEAFGKRLAWIKAYHEIQRIDNPPPPKLALPPWVRWVNFNDPGENKRSKWCYEVLDYDFTQDPPRPRHLVPLEKAKASLTGGGRK